MVDREQFCKICTEAVEYEGEAYCDSCCLSCEELRSLGADFLDWLRTEHSDMIPLMSEVDSTDYSNPVHDLCDFLDVMDVLFLADDENNEEVLGWAYDYMLARHDSCIGNVYDLCQTYVLEARASYIADMILQARHKTGASWLDMYFMKSISNTGFYAWLCGHNPDIANGLASVVAEEPSRLQDMSNIRNVLELIRLNSGVENADIECFAAYAADNEAYMTAFMKEAEKFLGGKVNEG